MNNQEIIQNQLEYYNNRDLENFANLFSESITAYMFPEWSQPLFSGIDDLRSRYKDRFENSPKLHSYLKSRIVLGDIVIDDEEIDGFHDHEDKVRIIAIYEVTNSKISKMWFVRGIEKLENIDPVDLQLRGYNSRDIDLFLTAYSDDCQIFDLQTGDLRMDGKESMRKRYSNLFDTSPELQAKVVQRVHLDNIVIDREEVAGFRENQKVNALAYNEVKNGLITRVWFSSD